MDQISPPFRIALVAMLAMCALWFTVLKPKDPGAAPATSSAPGTTGLANDVTAAKGAAAASGAANAKTQAATGGTQAPSAPAKATKPTATGAHAAVAGKSGAAPRVAATGTAKAAAGDRSVPLLKALERKHAVVLLFWNKRGIDDRAVRRAVAAASHRHGRVVVKTVPVADVGRYEAITSGAKVLESPTVLVIDPTRKARAIVGFTTKAEVDQATADALAAAK